MLTIALNPINNRKAKACVIEIDIETDHKIHLYALWNNDNWPFSRGEASIEKLYSVLYSQDIESYFDTPMFGGLSVIRRLPKSEDPKQKNVVMEISFFKYSRGSESILIYWKDMKEALDVCKAIMLADRKDKVQ